MTADTFLLGTGVIGAMAVVMGLIYLPSLQAGHMVGRCLAPMLWLFAIAAIIAVRLIPVDTQPLTSFFDPVILGGTACYLIIKHYILADTNHKALQSRLSDALCHIDEERRLLVGKLHDDLNPLLVVARLKVEDLRRMLGDEALRPDAAKTIKFLNDVIQQAYGMSRTIISGMETESLDTLGLALSIQSLVDRYKEMMLQTKITYTYTPEVSELHLPVDVVTNFFRIAQESLLNAIKHADAHLIDINLKLQNNTLTLTVEDNGRGLSTWSVGDGTGIVSMKERANTIRATFDVNNTSKGVRVSLSLILPSNPPSTLPP